MDYMICVYIPLEALDVVKDAMFDAGGGHYGAYDRCAWQTLGEGQFRPLAGSRPYAGEQGVEHRLKEVKVEMYCQSQSLPKVLAAMRAHHPYEEPGYFVLALN